MCTEKKNKKKTTRLKEDRLKRCDWGGDSKLRTLTILFCRSEWRRRWGVMGWWLSARVAECSRCNTEQYVKGGEATRGEDEVFPASCKKVAGKRKRERKKKSRLTRRDSWKNNDDTRDCGPVNDEHLMSWPPACLYCSLFFFFFLLLPQSSSGGALLQDDKWAKGGGSNNTISLCCENGGWEIKTDGRQ